MSEESQMEEADKQASVVPEFLLALKPSEAFELRCWWQRLTLPAEELRRYTDAPPWPKGVRARLRRCESLEAAMLTDAFRFLWQRLPESQYARRDERLLVWTCIALIAAEVRQETPSATLGSRLGKAKRETGKPHMSELRFQQLMECRSSEELIRRLRRALALIDKKDISIVHLADNIALWWREQRGDISTTPTKRLGFIWANDYFAAHPH